MLTTKPLCSPSVSFSMLQSHSLYSIFQKFMPSILLMKIILHFPLIRNLHLVPTSREHCREHNQKFQNKIIRRRPRSQQPYYYLCNIYGTWFVSDILAILFSIKLQRYTKSLSLAYSRKGVTPWKMAKTVYTHDAHISFKMKIPSWF